MVLMKFATKDDVAAAARSLRSAGYRLDWLVVNLFGTSASETEGSYAAKA